MKGIGVVIFYVDQIKKNNKKENLLQLNFTTLTFSINPEYFKWFL